MQPKKIKLFADSTSDLSKDLIDEMGIVIVPLYVNFKDAQFKDGVDLKENNLYEKVEQYNCLPKTAAPSPVDYEDAFRPYVENGYDILYIGISSKMSASTQNAKIAAEELPGARVIVIDSMNLSTGIGLQVCAAYDLIERGLLLEEIIPELKKLTTKIRTAFTIDSLDYLYKGGRCNAVQALLSGILQIKPIIKVLNGEMVVGAKIRGKKKKAMDYMLDEAFQYKDQLLFGRIFITHTSGSEEEAEYIKTRLLEEISDVKVYITYAGCVIASHCGKKTIGILFIAEDLVEKA